MNQFLKQLRQALAPAGYVPTEGIFLREISDECTGWISIVSTPYMMQPMAGIVCPPINRLIMDCLDDRLQKDKIDPGKWPPLTLVPAGRLCEPPRSDWWTYPDSKPIDSELVRNLAQFLLEVVVPHLGRLGTVKAAFDPKRVSPQANIVLPALFAWLGDQRGFDDTTCKLENDLTKLTDGHSAHDAFKQSMQRYLARLRERCF